MQKLVTSNYLALGSPVTECHHPRIARLPPSLSLNCVCA